MKDVTANFWETVLHALAEDIRAPDDGKFQEADWLRRVQALANDSQRASDRRAARRLMEQHERMKRRNRQTIEKFALRLEKKGLATIVRAGGKTHEEKTPDGEKEKVR